MAEHCCTERDGEQICQFCGCAWNRLPRTGCPGVLIYWKWQTAPEHLKTRGQISEQGLSIGSDAPAACVPNSQANRQRGYPWIWLYDVRTARPKRALTPAQLAAKDRVAEQHRQARTCKSCKQEHESARDLQDGLCEYCIRQEMLSEERSEASDWARKMLAASETWVVLDTETSGLDNPEIVQIAVVAPDGQEIFNTLVRPQGEIEPGAIAVHGITPEMVATAPTIDAIYERLIAVLAGKQIVAYNADFDRGVLNGECQRHNLPLLANRWTCAMEAYAAWYGEWSDYHQDFRWQRLPGGDHSAAGDCRAVLKIMHLMALDNGAAKINHLQD